MRIKSHRKRRCLWRGKRNDPAEAPAIEIALLFRPASDVSGPRADDLPEWRARFLWRSGCEIHAAAVAASSMVDIVVSLIMLSVPLRLLKPGEYPAKPTHAYDACRVCARA
jgi:hypothetical protein